MSVRVGQELCAGPRETPLWILVFGWWLALGHALTGIAQCVTIIGTRRASDRYLPSRI